MTEVISYRLQDSEELKKLAQQKGLTVSTLSSKIIEKHLKYYQYTEDYSFISMPRNMLTEIYNKIDVNDSDSIVNIATKIALADIKLMYDEPILQDVINYLHIWFDNNRFILKHFEKNSHYKLVCRHDMGGNWSHITAKILVEIFARLGYSGNIIETDDENFAIKINKD